jgi:hypothetical protein
MNDVMHDLLNKLRVISKIKEGQKLDTANGLNVYTEGWVNWLLRKWNRDNKDEGIRYLRELYKALQQSVETVINERSIQLANQKKSMATYVLINAASELKASVKGLDNMCKTYANFPTTVAALDGILKDYVIVTYSSLMEAIPEDKLTKDLRESITYGGVVVYNGKDGMHIPNVSAELVRGQRTISRNAVEPPADDEDEKLP